MKTFLVFVFLLLLNSSSHAQKKDKKLQSKIEALIKDFGGDIGIYVKNLESGKTVSINSDSIFPTASIVKLPIMVGIMDKINRGELTYHQSLTYRDSLLYAGVDILGSFKDSEKIDLSKVMMLMLTMSDNTASLWLQSLAGTGTRINEIMDSLGLQHTRVNSRTEGREGYRKQYGWGQTTPEEMARLVEMIVEGRVINPSSGDKMIRMMGRNYWDEAAISQIPAGIFVAGKTGAVNQSRNEIIYVNGNKTRYIFSIFTKNNIDQSWKDENEAWELTRKISALIWDHYSR